MKICYEIKTCNACAVSGRKRILVQKSIYERRLNVGEGYFRIYVIDLGVYVHGVCSPQKK